MEEEEEEEEEGGGGKKVRGVSWGRQGGEGQDVALTRGSPGNK